MRAALLGDAIAYQRVLVAIAPHVRSVARGVVGHRGFGTAEVEDVVQETLLAVHLKRATWDPEKPFLPWLNAVTRHKAIDAIRRKGGRVEMVIDDFHDLIATPEVDGDRQIDVETALAGLDQRQRVIVEQISLHGLSAAEVGVALKMSEGAVRVALHRALKSLAAKFGGETQ